MNIPSLQQLQPPSPKAFEYIPKTVSKENKKTDQKLMANYETAPIQFLFDNLMRLAIYRSNLISSVQEEVKQLTDDLDYLDCFLRYASIKKFKGGRRREREFVRRTREAVYNADDVVDAFVTQAAAEKSKNWISRFFNGKVKIDGSVREIHKIRDEVEEVYGERKEIIGLGSLEIGGEDKEQPQKHEFGRKNVDKDKVEKLIRPLTAESQRLDIISIIGMAGLGKTTLARKIFHNHLIQYEFPTRIWVDVSRVTPKHVFLSILEKFTPISEDIRCMTEPELAKTVSGHLEKGRFLIVMDDVRTPEDWDKLRIALPNSNRMGKVLITSRHESVASHANGDKLPYKLRFLDSNESWELLRYEVFGELECPPELKSYGKVIARRCCGIPLAIVVIGRILKNKISENHVCQKVSERVIGYLNDYPEKAMDRIVASNYDKLPNHLRDCFLYLGMFPEYFDISAWKLIRMWIAEGFIEGNIDFSLEETAESYLDHLINRNLVRVDKRSSDGRVKTCRIHDSIREFCKKEVGKDNENFLQEIKMSGNGILEPLIHNDIIHRRLCIHSNIISFVSSRPSGRRVRSFGCFSKEDISLPTEYISVIPGGFKLLRVLDVKPIKFPKLPSDMFDLIHLRYIHLSFNLSILPIAFSKFWNLQTLIINTTQRNLEIKADIWKMRQLRHLKTNASATLPDPTKDAKVSGDIQTLGTISSQNCTDKVFDKALSLKRLSIRGCLLELLEVNSNSGGSFESLAKLVELERLKLKNDVFPLPSSAGQLPYLPSVNKFPPNLRILTLSETFLNWSQMKVLGSLDKLEVLKLKDKAFMGDNWKTDDGGFRCLEVLFIGRTDLAIWKASSHHFPVLKRLELHSCEQLQEIPLEFADIPSLEVLDLNRCQTVTTSAKKIQEAKLRISERESENQFCLSIFPPS